MDNNTANTTINPYRRNFANNNNTTRTILNPQPPQNDSRIENNRNNNSIQEITNGTIQNNNKTNNPSLELPSDELSLLHFSYSSPNTKGEGDSIVNNTIRLNIEIALLVFSCKV